MDGGLMPPKATVEGTNDVEAWVHERSQDCDFIVLAIIPGVAQATANSGR